MKRKLIQLAAFGFTNMHVGNFLGAKIYTGPWKKFCVPGLNCYSCPAASFACPIGALQAVNGSMRYSFSFYVVGLLLAFGVILGRAICGFLCPFGLIQELIAKIPTRKRKLPGWTRYIKYAVLIWFVLLWPWLQKASNPMGMADPMFCKYVCPSGLLLAGLPLLAGDPALRSVIGPIFTIKACVLAAVIAGCVWVRRFFCKVLCPLGAIYGLLNKLSFYRLQVDRHACVGCGKCAAVCPMDVDPVRTPDSAECIRCGDCAHACPKNAIRMGFCAGYGKSKNAADEIE